MLDEELVESFQAILKRTGAKPQNLMLEITETSLMADVGSNRVMLERFIAMGLRLAVAVESGSGNIFGCGLPALQLARPVDTTHQRLQQLARILEVTAPEQRSTFGCKTIGRICGHRVVGYHDAFRRRGAALGAPAHGARHGAIVEVDQGLCIHGQAFRQRIGLDAGVTHAAGPEHNRDARMQLPDTLCTVCHEDIPAHRPHSSCLSR
jgi:hypothetical protein